MNYFWTDCPGCRCQVAVNSTDYPGRISGSLRRWSGDRSVNDGRAFEVPAASVGPGGEFSVECVCGAPIAVSGAMASRDAAGR
jgi:hypothetical protein